MLRQLVYSGFVHDSVVLNERVPINREGGSLFLCNYSGATRVVYVDESQGGVIWTNVGLIGYCVTGGLTGATIVPYGVGICVFKPNPDRTHIRLRLDARAEGDGMFFQIESASPVAAYLNQ